MIDLLPYRPWVTLYTVPRSHGRLHGTGDKPDIWCLKSSLGPSQSYRLSAGRPLAALPSDIPFAVVYLWVAGPLFEPAGINSPTCTVRGNMVSQRRDDDDLLCHRRDKIGAFS